MRCAGSLEAANKITSTGVDSPAFEAFGGSVNVALFDDFVDRQFRCRHGRGDGDRRIASLAYRALVGSLYKPDYLLRSRDTDTSASRRMSLINNLK